MSKINILDSSVFNRIAAGEVVDKPASVVKELVENSIDSGATSIDITIDKGGRYIKVTDNGCGIEREDLKTAFLPHATSKIKDISDLDAIGTLGFRGEALPSIASVAKVTMISRRKEDETGGRIVIENGNILEHTSAGAPYGTTVIVSDLFANVPARLKFLRSDRSEEGEITSLVQKFILANYDISISLTVSGKEIYRSEGKGLEDAAYSVLGSAILKEYDYVHEEAPGIEVYGYISKPAFSKHNRSYQTLIVNGRYVVNQDISFWIYNCYSHVLMKRQYPAYAIFINIPADMVDINVHPSKMEVKFIDLGRIKRLLSKAISSALGIAVTKPKQIECEIPIRTDSEPIRLTSDNDAGLGDLEIVGDISFSSRETAAKEPDAHIKSGTAINAEEKADVHIKRDSAASLCGAAGFSDTQRKYNIGRMPGSVGALNEPAVRHQSAQYTLFKDIIADGTGYEKDGYSDISEHRYCGKLFNTYLLLENHDEVILIDQHAAHERLLYDDLVKAVDNGKNTVQDLLIPYVFDVDYSEAELIDSHLNDIKAIGFELNRLSGNTYSLSSVPLVLCDMNLTNFVASLVDLLKRERFGKLPFMKNALMQTACKAAIKGEMNITDDDAKLLIGDICKKRIDLFCPHGRPIAVKLKKTEIEKWFKRIV